MEITTEPSSRDRSDDVERLEDRQRTVFPAGLERKSS